MDPEEEKSTSSSKAKGTEDSKEKRHLTLREATYKLKAEALRRYRLKHANDPEYVSAKPKTPEQKVSTKPSRDNTTEKQGVENMDGNLRKTIEVTVGKKEISQETKISDKTSSTHQLKSDGIDVQGEEKMSHRGGNMHTTEKLTSFGDDFKVAERGEEKLHLDTKDTFQSVEFGEEMTAPVDCSISDGGLNKVTEVKVINTSVKSTKLSYVGTHIAIETEYKVSDMGKGETVEKTEQEIPVVGTKSRSADLDYVDVKLAHESKHKMMSDSSSLSGGQEGGIEKTYEELVKTSSQSTYISYVTTRVTDSVCSSVVINQEPKGQIEPTEGGQGDTPQTKEDDKPATPVEPPLESKAPESSEEKAPEEKAPEQSQEEVSEEKAPEQTEEKAPEQTEEKPSEQTEEKAPEEKAPEQTEEKAPEQTEEKAPEQTEEKAPEQTEEKAPEQTEEKTPEQTEEKAPEQTEEKAPDQVEEKAPEQTEEKAPEQTKEKAPEQTEEKAPEQTEEKAPEQTEEGKEQENTKPSDESQENVNANAAKDGEEKKDGEEGQEKVEEKKEDADDEKKEEDSKEKEGDTNQNAGDDEEEKKEEKKVEEKKIPVDFFYNFEDLKSKADVTTDSGLPGDLLSLTHSFGYDCTKRANLHLLDDNTLCFAAGNLIVLLNLTTKEQTYIRSTSGGGVGAITVHPSRKYFAVAEKGNTPNINIFEYPSLKLYRILRGGTERSYSYIDFNPKGDLLASMGGDPDYMLTVWDWMEEQTVLRSKAFSQDVFRVTFSTELEGQLTTAGTSHIRFWKMADTFTGLKLQGELGKFGKTEISDIEGYVELPDGKVLSGCEWGNMLLWDGGLIKVEIGRKGRKFCHQGPIEQILLDEGELMTVGADGYIRVWDFESVDTADVVDESGLFEMEPMNELRVGADVNLKSIIKSVDTESEVVFWYAQDANGGIWKLDLTFSHTSQAPDKLFTYHAGAITGCDVSPLSHLVATTGDDHTVRVFDYVQRKQLCEQKFVDAGTCLIWAPRTVDPKATTILSGFSDGVVRVFNIGKADDHNKKHKFDIDLDLKQAFKPHTKKITSMAINDKGEILATGGMDNTIFFMNIGQTYEPIGFINTPSAVQQIQWSPSKFKKSTLLVFCDGGKVLEIDSPDGAEFDTSKTYHITGLPMREYTFKSIKSRLRHEEELVRKQKEEEARKKKEEEERRIRIERGLETESEHGESDDEDEQAKRKTPEAEWKPYIPEVPSPILTGFYSEEGKFWLSMGEFDAGYLYECEFKSEAEREKIPEEIRDEPLQAIPVTDSNDIPIRFLRYSSNGRQAIFGMEDGSIRIQNLETENNLSSFGPYWTMNFHDNNYGYITNLKWSYDEQMLLSVGGDGNFFLYDVMDQERVDQKVAEAKAKLPSAKKSEDKIVGDDIEDPNAYSIEDAKQKAEHDKMMKIAEEKKKEVRREIAKLRRQFKHILEQNEGLPNHLQLRKDEFELDREIKQELEKQKTDRIDIVRKELAWEAERQRIALEKLRKRYKDVVECERIVVKAFKSRHEVASFRAAKLSDDFYTMKADYERRKTMTMLRDDVTRDPTRDLLAGQQRTADDTTAVGGKQGETSGSKVTTTLKGSMGERINKALLKVEEKKKKRAARRAQWEELYDTKPDDDYEDPADVAAIKEAKDNMGDYKLKTAKDYVVPDHLRMNVEKARGRLLVLKDLIHEHKYNFNLRLLKIRDVKINIIEEIRDLVSQLQDTQSKLDPSKHKVIPPVPEMHPDEIPEKKLEYTRDTLLAFKKEMESKDKKGSDKFGGFGGFGGADAPTKTASPVHKASSNQTSRSTHPGEEGEEEVELSPLEQQLKVEEEIRLLYNQDFLLKRIEELVVNFDAELKLLRHDKFKLDITMKNADLRQVTLFEEFVLLKEYEKREDVLASKVSSKQQEKQDMQAKILDVQSKLDGKKKEIEKLQEREKVLYAQFTQSLGDNNKFAEYLTKVFKKKIKRAKKKTTEGDESDEDSDDDSDDDSDWDEEDEESDEEGGYDLDICPPGCDQNIYDGTCQLREKRLDIEEELQEEKKNNEALKKELDSLNKKLKVVDAALKNAQNDLEAFQLEKQQKLNELDVVVTLKLHQIQYMVSGVLPQDLSQTLVFESNGVTRLQQRIKELEHEKHSQKKHMKESRRKHVQLIKDRKVFESKVVEMDGQCNEMMIAKFGQPVDLEKLETIIVNRQIEELKEKLRVTEIQCSEELKEWDEKIATRKEQITNMIRDNTMRLDQLTMLLNEKKSYESGLDSRQKNSGEEFSGARKADVREKQRLIQLVQLQAQEIDALKEEIMLLSRKGGHILPPAQPPLPQSPPNMRTISN